MSRASNLLLLTLASCAGVAFAGLLWSSSPSPTPSQAEPSTKSPHGLGQGRQAPLACTFLVGEQRAYELRSLAGLADTIDRFEGKLSLEVVESSKEGALLRAAFTNVTLTQAMTQDQDRTSASALEASPFFIRSDDRCQLLALGFSPAWSTQSRQLVSTVLKANEIVLPGDMSATWETRQRDGSGEYVARYQSLMTEMGAQIVRHKQLSKAESGGVELGFELKIEAARTEAVFDRSIGAMRSVRGEERVLLTLPGMPKQTLTHSFSMTRRDDAFTEVASASLGAADFRDAFELEGVAKGDGPDPSLLKMDANAARARFLAIFDERGSDGVLPAAQLLAKWLRLHPEEAPLMLADLRQGKLAKGTHAALFLAFELAGSDATRDVLATAIQDPELSDLNRARAASALADHGKPTTESAQLLLKRAREDDSSMVATVSRLGLGSMAKRAEGALGDELHTLLGAELKAATGRADVVVAIDAIGNSADERFAPALIERLESTEPSVRAHAAEALGRLSPEASREALVARLSTEQDPQVISSLLRGLCALDAKQPKLSAQELTLAAQLLSSPLVGVRGLLIQWLGYSAALPEARHVLAAHFPREQDPKLKQLIGRFVSAAELRGQ